MNPQRAMQRACLIIATALFVFLAGCAEEEGAVEEDALDTDTMATGPGAMEDTTEAATVGVSEQEPYGAFLVDSEGMSLYLFEADEEGGESTCYEDCAEAWPPLLAEGEPTAGEQVDASLLGTIEREDGSQQVTYNGWPLYYFVKDQQPGDTAGQEVEGFGAEWYLVSPEGQSVETEGEGGAS